MLTCECGGASERQSGAWVWTVLDAAVQNLHFAFERVHKDFQQAYDILLFWF